MSSPWLPVPNACPLNPPLHAVLLRHKACTFQSRVPYRSGMQAPLPKESVRGGQEVAEEEKVEEEHAEEEHDSFAEMVAASFGPQAAPSEYGWSGAPIGTPALAGSALGNSMRLSMNRTPRMNDCSSSSGSRFRLHDQSSEAVSKTAGSAPMLRRNPSASFFPAGALLQAKAEQAADASEPSQPSLDAKSDGVGEEADALSPSSDDNDDPPTPEASGVEMLMRRRKSFAYYSDEDDKKGGFAGGRRRHTSAAALGPRSAPMLRRRSTRTSFPDVAALEGMLQKRASVCGSGGGWKRAVAAVSAAKNEGTQEG